jgi:hypothetical protein
MTSLEKQEDDDSFDTVKMERQNSTLETTNQPYLPRTYEESPYARRQWEYWVRQERLKRMDEFESVIYGGNKEHEALNEAFGELRKNRNKLEPEEFQKQLSALIKEEDKWDEIGWALKGRRSKAKYGFEARIKELHAFHHDVMPYRDGETDRVLPILTWILLLTLEGVDHWEIERMMGSIYREWLADRRQLEKNARFDRKKSLELQKELKDLELPRLVSKRNKGLKWPLKDDQVDLFNKVASQSRVIEGWRTLPKESEDDKPVKMAISGKLVKMVTTMHPYVDNKLRDTLEVGDYMRVSTNQHVKAKCYQAMCPPQDDDSLTNQEKALEWAKFVRRNHPRYRDPATKAEKNAKRIEAIKKAYPDYF